MAINFQNHFSLNFKHIIIDEIALSGLEGVGIDLLWRLVEKRISSTLTEKLKYRFWSFIVNCNDITIYQVPEPLPYVEILDRFAIVDDETGQVADPPDYLDGPYEYCPAENDYGSCIHYDSRALIPKEALISIPYGNIVAQYGDRLVMVASLEERWGALASHMPITYLSQMTPIHYCILELVGKGRENGQLTLGKTNLLKIMKDSKLLFYNRNFLQNLDLIRVHSITQVVGNKGMKSLLLRLKRFHKPLLLTMPTVGKLHNVVEYLLEQPDHSQITEIVIKKGLLDQKLVKKLQKTNNIFQFEERTVSTEGIPNKKAKLTKTSSGDVKRRFISLTSPSDGESSQSDEETGGEPLKCQYKVKMNLLRQAYERFLDAGLKGVTQIELAQLLGVEFYTARSICRSFKTKNIVREFMEDKGKQRVSRYIAVTATSEMDLRYETEKKKFLQYVVDSKNNAEQASTTAENNADTEVPSKRIKIEETDTNIDADNLVVDCKNIDKQVTEVKVIDGLENVRNLKSLLGSKKTPTLRQLRYANGILKVMQEKQAISGYQTLSTLVAKEINEPPMDTRTLKIFVQKLVTDGQLKILKMKRPGFSHQNYIVLICASHVKPTDPVIKAKYKELGTRAINSRKILNRKKAIDGITRPLSQYAYPRYMKIQKLHECIVKTVYFHGGNVENNDLPEGFSSLVQIIPEFTVEFALGNISHYAVSEIPPVSVTDPILNVKLQNTPKDIFKKFLLSSSLQSSIRTNLKVLAMLGLIQLVKETSPNYDERIILSYVFYVNRHAKIIDTSGTWPRQDLDKQRLEKLYNFETFQDVENYWKDIFNISTKTTITLASRPRKKLFPPLRAQKEVWSHDNGQTFGDGQGPCGFDSIFYMEMPRLWCTFYSKEKKQRQIMQKKPKIKPLKKEPKKKPKLPRRKRKVVVKPAYGPQSAMKRKKREKTDTVLKWSKEEDNIIMFCKAAITIMSPTSQPGCLRLRNFVAKDILTLLDPKKTGSNCHKRALLLESNSSLAYEKDCIINELRYRGDLIHKYEGLLKRLRINFSGNMSKLMLEGRIPMFELVWMMSQLIKSKSYKRRVACIAMDFEDFHKNFIICPSSANRYLNLYKTPEDCDTVIATIKEGVIMTVISSYKTVLTADVAKKIFGIFNMQSEQKLRTAVEQLRKSGAVAAKEKLLNSQMHRFNFQDIVQSYYKVAVAYERKWISRLNAEFVEQLAEKLHEEIPQTCLKGCPGLNCLVCELQTCNKLDIIFTTLPFVTGCTEEQFSVGDMETKLSLKSGSCGWRNKTNVKKFSDLYQHIEVKKNLEEIARNAVVETIAENQHLDMDEEIIAHLKTKQETGSTLNELQELTGFDIKILAAKLSALEVKKIIKRVGFYENMIVLTEFTTPWCLQIDDQHVIPTPWLTFNKDIRHDVFLKWSGVILNRVFESPGCSISYLAETCEHLTARSAQDVCMFLEKCECVTLSIMRVPEPDLFSDDDVIPESDDFNQYESVDNIFVSPVKDSLTKYSYIRKIMLNDVRTTLDC